MGAARSWKRALVLGGLVFFATGYPGCYGLSRYTHQIVHTRLHTYDRHGHQIVSRHGVEAGDDKWSPLPGLCEFIFTPLRWVELSFWYGVEPEGRPFGLP